MGVNLSQIGQLNIRAHPPQCALAHRTALRSKILCLHFECYILFFTFVIRE